MFAANALGINRLLQSDAFGLLDLQLLAADVGIDWERLPGDTKQEKALGLAREVARSGQVQALIERMKQMRPNIFDELA